MRERREGNRPGTRGARTQPQEGEEEEEAMTPIIPGSEEGKFYRPPAFLHTLRPKRKVAIVFGYIGERYCGLQWNKKPEYPTVEEALLKALFETSMISLANFATTKVQQKIDFERASRTDKGVHALRNVVSLNVMLPYEPAFVARKREERVAEADARAAAGNGEVLNNSSRSTGAEEEERPEEKAQPQQLAETESEDRFSYAEAKRVLSLALPADIHVYEVVPVTRSFNAYLNCGWRRYEYYLPTFCLMSKEEYSQQYFPASLAPARPSLLEVGVPLSATQSSTHLRRLHTGSVQDDAVASPGAEDAEDSDTPTVQWQTGGGANGFGRKSRGHFPMRKGKRQRLDAERAAQEPQPEGEDDNGADGTYRDNCVHEEGQPPPHAKEGAEADEPRLPPDQATATHFHDGVFETMILFRTIPEDAMRAVAAHYRLQTEQLERVRGYFGQYEGTACYHNFTPGGRGNDPSCNRFMKGITVSDPFIVYPDAEEVGREEAGEEEQRVGDTRVSSDLIKASVDFWSPSRFFSPDERTAEDFASQWVRGEEEGGTSTSDEERAEAMRRGILQHMHRVYGCERTEGDAGRRKGGIEVVRIELEGQSFLLNQIRKMIGAVICCCATNSPVEVIKAHLLNKAERRGIPMAPANGLFLSYLNFDRYNVRLDKIQSHGANGCNKAGLELESVDRHELVEWRARTVAVVLRNEMAEDMCGKWMRSLRCVLRLAWDTELP